LSQLVKDHSLNEVKHYFGGEFNQVYRIVSTKFVINFNLGYILTGNES